MLSDASSLRVLALRAVRWTGVLLASAMVTLAALVMAKSGDPVDFGQGDDAHDFINKSINISIDFSRRIAVSEKDPGDIIFYRENENKVLREVKGYCVRANYKGSIRLRVKDAKNRSHFALDSEAGDSIVLGVKLTDKYGGQPAKNVTPNNPMDISAAAVDYDCAGGQATTELEISGDFDPDKSKSGRYQTVLGLTFSAR